MFKGDLFHQSKTPQEKRLQTVAVIVCLCLIGLLIKLIILQISENEFLQRQGNLRTIKTIEIPSYRGIITDRRGTPLAVSTPVDSIWINPKLFNPTTEQVQQLSRLTNLKAKAILKKSEQNAKKSFLYIQRDLIPSKAKQISALGIKGLYLKREFRRYYPRGAEAAQLVGFTNIDDHGQSGLELMYDEVLRQVPGKKTVLEDNTGHWIKDIDNIQLPKFGKDIELSIDSRIQAFALRELQKALVEFKAKSATMVMLNVKTGEVLSMLSVPSFNPNNRHERLSKNVRNRALTDQYEPGSTAKAFSIASALESGEFTADSIIDTTPGRYKIGAHTVRDFRNYGEMSLKRILEKSSNVGVSKLTLSLPSQNLIDTLDSLGLGSTFYTHFPGESKGVLPAPPKDPFSHATLAFGYGFAVTPIQLANAFATIANRGIIKPVSLLKLPSEPEGTRVLSQQTSDTVIEMLLGVMNPKTGSGRRANIPGYQTAGKTGTIRVIGPNGYDPNRHTGLFAGFTPIDDPQLATVIIIEEPSEDHYYGGLIAAPIYARIVSGALHMLNIIPDQVPTVG